MDFNKILETLGDESFTPARGYTRLDEYSQEDADRADALEAADAEKRRKDTKARSARREAQTGSTRQGAAKSGINVDWDDKLNYFGPLGSDDQEVIPLSRYVQPLIRAEGSKSIPTYLKFMETKSENGVILNKFPQNCYPKYFTGTPSKDDDIKLYLSMNNDRSLGNAPLDLIKILADVEPSKTSGSGRNSLVSSTSFIKSKVTQAMGYSKNGVISRWTGKSGDVTHLISDLLFKRCRDYLGEIQSEDRGDAFGPDFNWESLRGEIEGILIKVIAPKDDYDDAKNSGDMTAGVEALIRYQYASLSKTITGQKLGKKFKVPPRGPLPLDLMGKIGDQHYKITLSDFFAYKTVLEFQKRYAYTSDEAIKIGDYLDRCAKYTGILTNITVAQTDAENSATVDYDNGNVVGGHDMSATPIDDNELTSESTGNQLRRLFSEKFISVTHTPTMREAFKNKLNILSEKSGAGRGVRMHSSGAIRDEFQKAMKFVAYDVMNKSTHRIFSTEPYDFNNYYSLDLRVDIDILLEFFTKDDGAYQKAFDNIYKPEFDENMRLKILLEYQKQYDADIDKLQTQNSGSMPTPPESPEGEAPSEGGDDGKTTKLNNPSVYQGLTLEQLKKALSGIYKEIGVVSLFIDETKEERITIKQDEFVDLVKTGLSSAIRGNVPQGVTIEEILDGKFSRKAIAPDQGTFINRVKDPTSDKEFDFRSWTTTNLKDIHEIIMDTFKNDPSLKGDSEIDKNGGTFTRESIMLYLSQDDFHQLEQGGKGMDTMAKKALSSLGQMNDELDW